MAGDDDRLQGLSIRMSTAKRRVDIVNSTLDLMVQEIKKLSFKLNDRILADGIY